MKIAIVNDTFLPKIGGIEMFIADLAANMVKLGHDVHIVTTDRRKQERISDTGYTVFRLPLRRLFFLHDWAVCIDPRTWKLSRRMLERESYDVLIINHLLSLFALGGKQLCSLRSNYGKKHQ